MRLSGSENHRKARDAVTVCKSNCFENFSFLGDYMRNLIALVIFFCFSNAQAFLLPGQSPPFKWAPVIENGKPSKIRFEATVTADYVRIINIKYNNENCNADVWVQVNGDFEKILGDKRNEPIYSTFPKITIGQKFYFVLDDKKCQGQTPVNFNFTKWGNGGPSFKGNVN